MNGPTLLDHLLLLAFAVAYPIHGSLAWPRLVAASRAGRANVRVHSYIEVIAVEWTLAVPLLVHWGGLGRPWSQLGLGDAFAGSGPYAFVAVIALAVLALLHARGVARVPAQDLAKARASFGEVVHFLPRSIGERRLFAAVAITAGSCEELLYRGFAPWFLAAYGLSPVLSTAAATLLFGLAHAYQGVGGIVRTLLVGAVMAVVSLWAGTIWPAVLLHVVVDLHGGSVGGRIARAAAPESVAS